MWGGFKALWDFDDTEPIRSRGGNKYCSLGRRQTLVAISHTTAHVGMCGQNIHDIGDRGPFLRGQLASVVVHTEVLW